MSQISLKILSNQVIRQVNVDAESTIFQLKHLLGPCRLVAGGKLLGDDDSVKLYKDAVIHMVVSVPRSLDSLVPVIPNIPDGVSKDATEPSPTDTLTDTPRERENHPTVTIQKQDSSSSLGGSLPNLSTLSTPFSENSLLLSTPGSSLLVVNGYVYRVNSSVSPLFDSRVSPTTPNPIPVNAPNQIPVNAPNQIPVNAPNANPNPPVNQRPMWQMILQPFQLIWNNLFGPIDEHQDEAVENPYWLAIKYLVVLWMLAGNASYYRIAFLASIFAILFVFQVGFFAERPLPPIPLPAPAPVPPVNEEANVPPPNEARRDGNATPDQVPIQPQPQRPVNVIQQASIIAATFIRSLVPGFEPVPPQV